MVLPTRQFWDVPGRCFFPSPSLFFLMKNLSVKSQNYSVLCIHIVLILDKYIRHQKI